MPDSTKRLSSPTRTIDQFNVGNATWRVESHCGVVRITNGSHYVCVLNSIQARDIAERLADALLKAADSVDRASAGGER